MSTHHPLTFITTAEAQVEELPWGPHEWLAKGGLTESSLLQLVRVTMPPGQAHQFHRHPSMEEIIYSSAAEPSNGWESSTRFLVPET